MGFSTDLLRGLAQLLADAGVATWRPDGTAYLSSEIPIALGGVPSRPDKAIALALYGPQQLTDDVTQADSVTGLQLRFRGVKGDTTAVDDMADDAFDALHGLSERVLSTGVLVLLCERRIVAVLGMDDNGRYERADSYDLTVHRPSTYRTE